GGGPAVRNFSWAQAEAESELGVTWATVHVVGTFENYVLTLTEPPQPPRSSPTPKPTPPRLAAPCPPPAGGWRIVDSAKVSQQNLQEAMRAAHSEADFAGAWVDQSINPTPDNDPAKLV